MEVNHENSNTNETKADQPTSQNTKSNPPEAVQDPNRHRDLRHIKIMLTITRKCPFTGAINTKKIEVTQDQIDAWNNGKLIQEAMPDLTNGEREFIKTGITDDVWAATFHSPFAPGAYDMS